MFSDPTAFVQHIGSFIWGPLVLIPLLLLTGLFLTVRLRGLQFTKLWHSLWLGLLLLSGVIVGETRDYFRRSNGSG